MNESLKTIVALFTLAEEIKWKCELTNRNRSWTFSGKASYVEENARLWLLSFSLHSFTRYGAFSYSRRRCRAGRTRTQWHLYTVTHLHLYVTESGSTCLPARKYHTGSWMRDRRRGRERERERE